MGGESEEPGVVHHKVTIGVLQQTCNITTVVVAVSTVGHPRGRSNLGISGGGTGGDLPSVTVGKVDGAVVFESSPRTERQTRGDRNP